MLSVGPLIAGIARGAAGIESSGMFLLWLVVLVLLRSGNVGSKLVTFEMVVELMLVLLVRDGRGAGNSSSSRGSIGSRLSRSSISSISSVSSVPEVSVPEGREIQKGLAREVVLAVLLVFVIGRIGGKVSFRGVTAVVAFNNTGKRCGPVVPFSRVTSVSIVKFPIVLLKTMCEALAGIGYGGVTRTGTTMTL